jgi:hypothetical protein
MAKIEPAVKASPAGIETFLPGHRQIGFRLIEFRSFIRKNEDLVMIRVCPEQSGEPLVPILALSAF